MARKKTLGALLDDLRAETKASLNPAHNKQVRDVQIKLLQRVQDWLWEDYDWPHLKIERDYPLGAGQRFYDFGTTFDLERINSISVKDGGLWRPLEPEINDTHYLAHDSALDQQAYPPRCWRIWEGDQIEIWPISDTDGTLATFEGYIRVKGIRRLSRFIADEDRADLDDRLIVLFAAAETLGGRGAKDAQIKMDMAKDRLTTLRGHLTKGRRFQMFGVGRAQMPHRPFIGAYRAPGT